MAETSADRADSSPQPGSRLKWAVLGATLALVAGALYLMVVRGPALLLDLAAAYSSLICF